MESSNSAEREELLANLEEGVTKGIVKNLADYGAFVDLGIDGLFITDMSWKLTPV